MDDFHFDNLARRLASGESRRSLLRGVAASLAGLVAATGWNERADARRVTQASCGNKVCADDPSVCSDGCVCCEFGNGNSRCMPPKDCQRRGGDVACPDGQRACDEACIPVAACCTADECPEPEVGSCQGERTCIDGTCGFAPIGDDVVCRRATDGCHADAVCTEESSTCPPNPLVCAEELCCAGTCCSEGQDCIAGMCANQETFSTPGSYTWSVPSGVDCASFEVSGAQGGSNSSQSRHGGVGGRLQATLHLTPGQEFSMTVGALGGSGSGDGGGRGSEFDGNGGGGSAVAFGTSRLLVAGGGGGAAYANEGGAGGGLSGSSGESYDYGHPGTPGEPGAGGTQSGPGAGGGPNGQDGAGPDGGDGGAALAGDYEGYGGGGGGGGYYGGGGGGGSAFDARGAGGGGGSGFISGDTTIVVAGEFLDAGQTGDGLIRITYPVACPT